MKKTLFIIYLILLIPTNVFASDIYEFKYTDQKVYDLSNIYTNEEEKKLTNSINNFTKFSGLELILVTTDTEQEENKISNNIYYNQNFGKGLYKNGILITYTKDNNFTQVHYFGDGFRDKMSLQKFRIKHLDEYSSYISNPKRIEPKNIDYTIREWTNYYIVKNIEIIILITILSIIVTYIFLKQIRKKYNILEVKDAKNYYDENEVELIK